MKQGWEYKKLIDICNIQYGYPFVSKLFCNDSSFPQLVRIRDVSRGYSETYYSGDIPDGYYVDKGDYLIGMDGEFNIAAWNSERALLNQRVCKISANEATYDRFLYYNLRIILKQIEDETPFVTVKHLSAKKLNTVMVYLPPLSEQQRIVEELDLLDSIIEKKKAQLAELDKLAQSLFYEMFGDPITNEKGWDLSTFKNEFAISSGGTPSTSKKEYWNNGTISWIGSNLCQNKILTENDGKYITQKGFENSSAKLYSKGYVIVALVGATIGKCALLRFDTTTNQNIAGIDVPSNKEFESYFVFYMLQSLYDLFQNIGEGKFKMANLSFVRSLPIIKPPIDLQNQFAERIQAIEYQKELIKKSIKEVETLFNSRMDYYFN